jgi:hypothetical protein
MVCLHYWPGGICSSQGTCVTLAGNETITGVVESWCACNDGYGNSGGEFYARLSTIPKGYDMDCALNYSDIRIVHYISIGVITIGLIYVLIGFIGRCRLLYQREPPIQYTSKYIRRWIWQQARAFPTRTMIIVLFACVAQLGWGISWIIDSDAIQDPSRARHWRLRIDIFWILYSMGMNTWAMELSVSWFGATVRSLPLTGTQSESYGAVIAAVGRYLTPIYISTQIATLTPLLSYIMPSAATDPNVQQDIAIASLITLAYQPFTWVAITLFLLNRLLVILTASPSAPLTTPPPPTTNKLTLPSSVPPPQPMAGATTSISVRSPNLGNPRANTTFAFASSQPQTSSPLNDGKSASPMSDAMLPSNFVVAIDSATSFPVADTLSSSSSPITVGPTVNMQTQTTTSAIKTIRLFRSILINAALPIPIPSLIFAIWPYLRLRSAWVLTIGFPLLIPGMCFWVHKLKDRAGPQGHRLHPMIVAQTPNDPVAATVESSSITPIQSVPSLPLPLANTPAASTTGSLALPMQHHLTTSNNNPHAIPPKVGRTPPKGNTPRSSPRSSPRLKPMTSPPLQSLKVLHYSNNTDT